MPLLLILFSTVVFSKNIDEKKTSDLWQSFDALPSDQLIKLNTKCAKEPKVGVCPKFKEYQEVRNKEASNDGFKTGKGF